jgi:cell division ATPase FtsA
VKLQFGVALSDAAEENKVIVIPARIPGREPKEISIRNLAHIIQARMEEIIDGIMFEIENSGYGDKLGSGIVITGGGAMLRHLKELFNFHTRLDVRVGLPGAHLSGDSDNINEPSYATGVGLLIQGFEYYDHHPAEMANVKFFDPNAKPEPPPVKPELLFVEEEERVVVFKKTKEPKPVKSFDFSNIIDRFKTKVNDFFDEAEPKSRMEEEKTEELVRM